MDEENNYRGLYYCAPAWVNNIYNLETLVERYIDSGYAVRVGENSQGRLLIPTNNSEKR